MYLYLRCLYSGGVGIKPRNNSKNNRIKAIEITTLQLQDGKVEGHVLIFSCENSKITTRCWTIVNRRLLHCTKKDTPLPKAKENPQQDGRRHTVAFRIKPYTHQRCLEGSIKTLCTPGDSTETEPDLPLSVWVSPEEVQISSGLLQGQGLWLQQTWVWHKPSWRRAPLTPP